MHIRVTLEGLQLSESGPPDWRASRPGPGTTVIQWRGSTREEALRGLVADFYWHLAERIRRGERRPLPGEAIEWEIVDRGIRPYLEVNAGQPGPRPAKAPHHAAEVVDGRRKKRCGGSAV